MDILVTVAVTLLAIGWIAFVFLRWPPRNRRANPKHPARRHHWGIHFYVGGTGSATGERRDGTGDDWGGGDLGGGGGDSGGGGDGGSGGD